MPMKPNRKISCRKYFFSALKRRDKNKISTAFKDSFIAKYIIEISLTVWAAL